MRSKKSGPFWTQVVDRRNKTMIFLRAGEKFVIIDAHRARHVADLIHDTCDQIEARRR